MLEHEEPSTVDEESLALHKSDFRKKYIAARQSYIQQLSTALQSFINGDYDYSPMPLVFQYLQQMGIQNVKKDDLLQLLPVATGDAVAIDIMSEVRAYYQGEGSFDAISIFLLNHFYSRFQAFRRLYTHDH